MCVGADCMCVFASAYWVCAEERATVQKWPIKVCRILDRVTKASFPRSPLLRCLKKWYHMERFSASNRLKEQHFAFVRRLAASCTSTSNSYFHITHGPSRPYSRCFHKVDTDGAVSHSALAEYRTPRSAERTINLFISQCNADWQLWRFASLQMKEELSLLIFRFIALVWVEGLEGECCLIYFPSPQRSISNWTFLMINWATPWRGLTPCCPTRKFPSFWEDYWLFFAAFSGSPWSGFPAERSTSLFRTATLALSVLYIASTIRRHNVYAIRYFSFLLHLCRVV